MKIKLNQEKTDEVYAKLKISEKKYSQYQFYLGMNVELEHGLVDEFTNVTNDDLELTGKIVLAHLNEIPNYYDFLMEAETKFDENVGKVVLITGGSEGLGKEIAVELSKICTVIITGIDEVKLAEVSKELNCDYFVCDVTDYEKSNTMVEEVIKKHKKIDVLINNAGILFEGEIFELNENQISSLIDVNVKGVEYMTNIVSKSMIANKNGLIINIVSQSGFYHRRLRSLYNSSKWAITGFTKCLAADMAKFNVKVSGIYPGKMNTNIFENTKVDPMEKSLDPKVVAKAVRFVVETNGDAFIPEIGIKSLKQETHDEVSY